MPDEGFESQTQEEDPRVRMMAALTAAKVHLGVPPLLNAADEAPDDRCVLLYLALLKRAVTQREDTHFSASTPTAANQRSGQLSAADADGVQRHGRGSAAVNADAAARAGGEGLVRSGADLSEEELRRLQARHNQPAHPPIKPRWFSFCARVARPPELRRRARLYH